MDPAHTFPPAHHFFRDLGYRVVRRDGREVGCLPAQAGLHRADGALPVGALVTLVDMVTGRTAQRAAAPAYPITADIDLRLAGRGSFDEYLVTATLLHRGQRSCVLEAEISARRGEHVERIGLASANFALFPPLEDFPLGRVTSAEDGIDFGASRAGLTGPLPEQLGIRTCDAAAGRVEIDVDDYVRNPVGVLQGGVHAVLIEHAVELFSQHRTGSSAHIEAATLRYLSAGRVGPIQTTVRGAVGDRLLVVDLRDVGGEDRRVTTAVVALA